jgi:hypothetical protein
MPARLPEEIVEAMLAMGIRASADRTTLTVYLPSVLAELTCRNLAHNGDIAVTLERPIDLKAVQIKGHSIGIRPSTEADRELQAIYRSALVEQLGAVGVPRSVTRRLTWWPSLAVDVRIRDVFFQTPGPDAGEPMGGA